jgi:hypothetical protein
MLHDASLTAWLVLALAIVVAALLVYIVSLRLELWASRRIIAALEMVDAREPKQARGGKSIVPALLAWAILLLVMGQALGYLF